MNACLSSVYVLRVAFVNPSALGGGVSARHMLRLTDGHVTRQLSELSVVAFVFTVVS